MPDSRQETLSHKAHEMRVRRKARRKGFIVTKSRSQHPDINDGYQLLCGLGYVHEGHYFELDLDFLDQYLDEFEDSDHPVQPWRRSKR